MGIYYFIGNKVKGIDLTNELENISIELQKKRALKNIDAHPKTAQVKSLLGCIELASAFGYKYEPISPNIKYIEGEHEDRLYYLHKYVIKWCKKRSLKALLIRLVGVDIDCPNRQ